MIYYNGQKVVKAYLNGYVYDRNHKKRIHSPTEDPAPVEFGDTIKDLITNNGITAFIPSPTAPPSGVTKYNVGKSDADPLWMWIVGTTLYYFSYSHQANVSLPQGATSCPVFRYQTTLVTIDLSELLFDDDMIFTGMFYGDSALKTVVFGPQEFHPTILSGMFANCSSIEVVDLSAFYTDRLDNSASGGSSLYVLFDGCLSLKTVYVNKDWSIERLTAHNKTYNTFGVSPSCDLLVGGNGSTLASIRANKQESEPDANRTYWARIDTPSQMGLFTLK